MCRSLVLNRFYVTKANLTVLSLDLFKFIACVRCRWYDYSRKKYILAIISQTVFFFLVIIAMKSMMAAIDWHKFEKPLKSNTKFRKQKETIWHTRWPKLKSKTHYFIRNDTIRQNVLKDTGSLACLIWSHCVISIQAMAAIFDLMTKMNISDDGAVIVMTFTKQWGDHNFVHVLHEMSIFGGGWCPFSDGTR